MAEQIDVSTILARASMKRSGKGDHVSFNKRGVREVITLDTGRREIPMPILKRIYKIAGWRW